MSEMVEIVARAMFDSTKFLDDPSEGLQWDEMSDEGAIWGRDFWRERARAAITAMRKPTGRMRWAILIDPRTNRNGKSKVQHALDCWRAMIDEALK